MHVSISWKHLLASTSISWLYGAERNAPVQTIKELSGRRKTSKNKWKIVKLNSPTLNIINIPTRLRSENIRAEEIVVEKQKTAPSTKIFSECVSKHMNRLEARNTRCSCLIQVDLNCDFCSPLLWRLNDFDWVSVAQNTWISASLSASTTITRKKKKVSLSA